ncbi:MAG: hypothetical protein ABL929_07835 [Ferruginibacter sp.]|nr:hypothetical protein [Ferruginibacter sp.]
MVYCRHAAVEGAMYICVCVRQRRIHIHIYGTVTEAELMMPLGLCSQRMISLALIFVIVGMEFQYKKNNWLLDALH